MEQSYIGSCKAVNTLRCLTGNNRKCNFYQMKLSERIKKARKHAKLTQAQLSVDSGVKQQVISKLENDKQFETAGIIKIARACGVSADWLEDETGPMLLSPYVRDVIKAMYVMEPKEQSLAASLIKTVAQSAPATPNIETAVQPDLLAPEIEKPAPKRPASAVSGGPPRTNKKSHVHKKTA